MPISAAGAMAARFAGTECKSPSVQTGTAMGAQIREIDPRRAALQAVDQHAGLRTLFGIMGAIAAVPHRSDNVFGLMSGRRLEPPRDRTEQLDAGKQRRAKALIERR